MTFKAFLSTQVHQSVLYSPLLLYNCCTLRCLGRLNNRRGGPAEVRGVQAGVPAPAAQRVLRVKQGQRVVPDQVSPRSEGGKGQRGWHLIIIETF